MKTIKIVAILLFFALATNAQEKLPLIKSSVNVISIEDGSVMKKDSWTLVPDAKPDIYETSVKQGQKKKITFITDLDKISFEVEAGKTYDFIIQKGDAMCYTQIKAHLLNFWNDKDFWESPSLKTSYKENLSNEEKIAGLSKFWSEVKYNFVNFHLVPELDWDKTYLEYIPKVLATNSTLDYYKTLMEMCSKLKDAHTNVYTPDELDNEFYARPLIRTRLVEDKVLIIDIYDESLKQNGLAIGQEVVEIDGIPVKEYAEKNVKPYQSASTPQDLQTRLYEYALFSGSLKSPLNLTLRDPKGNLLKKTIFRVSLEERGKKIPFSAFEFKMLPENVAYVALNTFGNNYPAEMFAKNFPEISKADSLIIDLRNNGGGNSGVGYSVLSYLINQSFKGSKWYTREYHPTYRAWSRPEKTFGSESAYEYKIDEIQKIRGEKTEPFLKPVIVLTSPRTFSAAEDFLVAFKPLKRGLVIGEPSGGSTGQPLVITLPGGGTARICSKHDTFPDGTSFVGVGIFPDIAVAPKISDMINGKDTVLEAALQQLKKNK